MHGHDEPEVSTGDPARLLAIRRHLASFLPVSLIERFWHDGFASTRQPSFRLNALRLHNRGDRGGGGISGGDGVVRELLSGFGLPSDTPVERCPYHPLARLLPSRTAAAVRVAQQVHELRPLRAGAVYFMGLSSMLPALALMAHPNHPNHSNHYNHHRHRHQMVRPQQQWPTPHDDSKHGNRSGSSDGISDGVAGAVGARPLRVLDLCAAPGGKTALLAELLGNRGTLLAVDSSWPRLQRLQFNVERLVPNHHNDFNLRNGRNHLNDSCARVVGDGDGARRSSEAREAAAAGATRPWWRRGCVVAVHADGTRLRVDEHGLPLLGSRTVRRRGSRGGGADELEDDDEGEIGVYDRILVDAPCSGLGRLQLQRPSSYSRWDEQHVARHPERQRQLLLRGVRLLRRGGSLVYSTCTIDPRENEAVVAWLLGRVGGLRLVEPLLHLPTSMVPERLTPPLHTGARVPDDNTDIGATADAVTTTTSSGSSSSDSSSSSGGIRSSSSDINSSSSGISSSSGGISSSSSDISSSGRSSSSVISVREALEVHRPGCTYPALLDGAWWDEVEAEEVVSPPAGRRPGGGRMSPRAYALFELGRGLGGGRLPGTGNWSREGLRNQLESYCVRVAPGPTYEGFFLAQFVKD